jgi:hypothetical protein
VALEVTGASVGGDRDVRELVKGRLGADLPDGEKKYAPPEANGSTLLAAGGPNR